MVANGIHLDCVICIPKLNTHDKHVLVAASLTFKINVILKVRQVHFCSQIFGFSVFTIWTKLKHYEKGSMII